MRLKRKQFRDHLLCTLSRAGILPTELQRQAKIRFKDHGGALTKYLNGERNLNIDDLGDYLELITDDSPEAVTEILGYFAQRCRGRHVLIPANRPQQITPADVGAELCDLVKQYLAAIADGVLDPRERQELLDTIYKVAPDFIGCCEGDERAA